MTLEQVQFASVWIRDLSEFTSDYSVLVQEETGLGDNSLVAPSTTIVRGRNADGKIVDLVEFDDPTTDTETITIDFYGQYDQIHTLEKKHQNQEAFHLQLLSFATPPTDIRTLAKKVKHWRARVTGGSSGAGPNRDGTAGLRENSFELSLTEQVQLNLSTSLSRVTTTAAQDGQSLVMITDNLDRKNGYRGPDKIMYAGINDTGAAPGAVWVSNDGGSSFAAITTDPTPFTVNSGINALAYKPISETQYRLVVGREGDAGTDTEFAYGDFTHGSEAADPSWTVITIAATANNDAVEAMLWPESSRLYIATAGDVYLSMDLGESDPGAAIFTGSNALNQFFYDFERNVWAAGDSNTILIEQVNNRGTFTAKTGPSGGGAFTAIARAEDGVIWAGNGTSIFYNTNKSETAGGWTSSKDFGANHVVKNIFCVNGSSQVIYAIVTDDTGNDGDFWFTTNGGVTWTEKSNLADNNGYNAAVISEQDPNMLFAVGPIETTTYIAKLS